MTSALKAACVTLLTTFGLIAAVVYLPAVADPTNLVWRLVGLVGVLGLPLVTIGFAIRDALFHRNRWQIVVSIALVVLVVLFWFENPTHRAPY